MTELDLKEYIKLTLTPIELRLSQIAQTVDKSISSEQFDQLRFQVASLSELMQSVDERLDKLEQHDNIGTWLLRQSLVVGTALLIGWLSGVIKV